MMVPRVVRVVRPPRFEPLVAYDDHGEQLFRKATHWELFRRKVIRWLERKLKNAWR